MRIRWLLGTLVAAAAVGAATALVGRPGFAPEIALAGNEAPPAGGEAAPEGTRRAPVPKRRYAKARPAASGGDAPGAADGAAATAGDPAQLEEELRWTRDAIEASRRLSDPARVEPDPAPAPEARDAAGTGMSGSILCRGSGFECRSSAECCPGLACAGGVAGYGTSGRCVGADAR